MIVVIKVPGEEPSMTRLCNNLSIIQHVVGGFIECVPYRDDIVMIVNEDGKLTGLRENFNWYDDVIVGNVVFCRSDGEDFTDLTIDDVKSIYNDFAVKEMQI